MGHLNIWWDTKNHFSICLSMSHLTRPVRKAERQKAESQNREKLRFRLLHSAMWKDNSGRTPLWEWKGGKKEVQKSGKLSFWFLPSALRKRSCGKAIAEAKKWKCKSLDFGKNGFFNFCNPHVKLLVGKAKLRKPNDCGRNFAETRKLWTPCCGRS